MKLLRTGGMLLLTALLTLFAVGCGDSNEQFVVTNGPVVPTTNNADLIFRFSRPDAQTVTNLEADADTLRFDLHSGNPPSDGNLLFSETRLYAPVVVLNDVSLEVEYVVVTVFDRNGLPLSRYAAPVEVTGGGEIEVNLGAADPIDFQDLSVAPDQVILVVNDIVQAATARLNLIGTFDGMELELPIDPQAITFTAQNPLLVSMVEGVLTTDLLKIALATQTEAGVSTTATVGYTLRGVTREDTIEIAGFVFIALADGGNLTNPSDLTFELEAGQSYPGVEEDPIQAAFIASDGSQSTLDAENDDLSFALESPVSGISVDSETGVITTTENATLGDFTVLVTWTDDEREDASGLTFTSPVRFRLVEPTP